ncbi:MAG: hypothetical protein ACTH2Q_14420 [Propionibacteriaceae bacterium]
MNLRGVRQVAEFNWPKLLGGTVVAGVGLALWRRLPWWGRVGTLTAAYAVPASLLASWWTYDLSPLPRWRFFTAHLSGETRRILLVIAGFDEVSATLAEVFGDSRIDVVDVVAEPEATVRRARKLYPAEAPVIDPRALGEASGDYDLVLFAQSAHEIRDPLTRATMFAAARSAVRDGGAVVVVEHLLDLPNAVAFGPGALHFHTERAWLASFAAGGLRVRQHSTVMPLVHCWVLEAV